MGAAIGRREENKRKKREALLQQGLEHFSSAGYSAASIEQIASAAGVARGTFYLYFPDKLALFRALTAEWYEPLSEVLEQAAERVAASHTREEIYETYQEMASGLAVLGLAYADAILLAFQTSRQPHEAGQLLREQELALVERVVAFTELACSRGLLDVNNPRVACLVVYGAVERLFYEFLHGSDLGDPSTLAAEVVSLFGTAMGFRP